MNSKKLMITAIVLSAVLLLAVAIFGGLALSGDTHGAHTSAHGQETSEDPYSGPQDDTSSPAPETVVPYPGNDTDVPGADTQPSAPVTSAPTTPSQSSTETNARQYREAAGRLSSTNEGYIKLIIDWKTVSRTTDEAIVECQIKLSFYTLDVGPRFGGRLTVAGKTYSFDTAAISYDELEKHEVVLGTVNAAVPLISGCGSTVLTCSWPFKGSYSGISYDELSINGILEISD